jgi:hypothetical protein
VATNAGQIKTGSASRTTAWPSTTNSCGSKKRSAPAGRYVGRETYPAARGALMTGSGAASGRRGPLVLVVMDGWGLREQREGNAIRLARTPTYLELLDRFPHSSLQASGEEVGLPAGQMGNSEVGHITMGAGRVVYQD